MDQIVVNTEDKFINEAFQKWCFKNGIFWVGSEKLIVRSNKILIRSDYDKFFLFIPTNNIEIAFVLPKQWDEATAAILKMIKPKEKKWTDDDMIEFAKRITKFSGANSEWLHEQYLVLFKEFIKNK